MLGIGLGGQISVVYHQHGSHERLGWADRLASLKAPTLVVSNSNYSASSAANLFPNVRSVVWHYLMSPPPALPAGTRNAVRAGLGVDSGTNVIIQVSRMEAWKGHELHLKALAALREAPPWELWFVGGAQRPKEAEYEAHLRQITARLGIQAKVRFLGQRNDVPALLAAADVFCQPNALPEPYGMVFLEAMAAGLPVVSSDMGGPKEFIDASCGFLVPDQQGDLVSVLERLLRDDGHRRALGARGPQRAFELSDPRRQLELLKGHLEATVGG
jgi:glycosyltransferase involved in cell wall biosynthesis